MARRVTLVALCAGLSVLGWRVAARVQTHPIPFVESIDPHTVGVGAEVQFTATGLFSDGDQVTVDGAPLATIMTDEHELRATIPANLLSAERTLEIRVQNGSGRSQPQPVFVSNPRVGFAIGGGALPVASAPTFMTMQRLNADARPDLVFIAPDDGLYVAFADTAGGFNPPAQITLASRITHVASVDMDGDGDEDLFVGHGDAGVISVMANDGSGGFSVVDEIQAGHGNADTLAVADMNRDGEFDIVAANTVEGTIGVHIGAGNGTFVSQPSFASLSQPISPVIGDMNRDGLLDIIVLSADSGTLALHAGQGGGTFAAATNIPAPAGTSPGLDAGDVNGDGLLDLVFPRAPQFFGFPSVQVLLGDGDGTFTEPPPPLRPVVVPFMRSLDLTDVDGDGDLDAVGVDGFQTLHVLRGDRSGRLIPWTTRQLAFQPFVVDAADVNNDGRVDFIVAGSDTSVFPAQGQLVVVPQLDPGPPPQLVLPDATVTEGDGISAIARIPVLLVSETGQSVTSTVPITITLSFADGSAHAPADYRPSPATEFTIGAGVSEGTIDFRIGGGTNFEPTETFTVTIATVEGGVIQDGTATVTIMDNDPPPPNADLSTIFDIVDPIDSGAAVTGTVKVFNNGPNVAQSPGAAVQIGFFDQSKLSNVQVTATNFLVSGVNGSVIQGASLALAPADEAFLTFTAAATAAASASQDFFFTGSDPTRLLQLNYAFNRDSSPGRLGVSFSGDNDARVNDVVLHDPQTNILRIVRNVDTRFTTQNLDLASLFPEYVVSTLRVCAIVGDGSNSVVLGLVPQPGAVSTESLLVTRAIPIDPIVPVTPDFFEVERTGGFLAHAKCVDIDGDGDDDLLSIDRRSTKVVLFRNDGGTLVSASETPTDLASADGLVVGDFNQDGRTDVGVFGTYRSFDPEPAYSILKGNGAGGLDPGVAVVDLRGVGASTFAALAGGLEFDPIDNTHRPIDLNRDGYPDLVAACTDCGEGGRYAVVPLRNLGAEAPGTFVADTPLTLGIPGRTFGSVSMLGTPLVNETLISLTAKDGYNALIENATPANAQQITLRLKTELTERTRRVGGSGPSAIVPLNAFDDEELDLLLLDVRGGIQFDVAGASQTLDLDPANNGERRTVGIRPGPPHAFDFKVGAAWTPNALGQLENRAADATINSLNGARVYAQDQSGNRTEFPVLSSSNTAVTFTWPLIAAPFKLAGANVRLFAETAGGTGTSITPPIIEADEEDPPIVSIVDASAQEDVPVAGSAVVRVTVTLSKPSDEPVTVRLATSDDSAFAPFDYLSTALELVFDPGQTQIERDVLLVADHLDEPDETFFVNLSNAVGASIGDGQAIATIVDDDDPPRVQYSNLRTPEGNAGSKRVAVTATLVGPSGAANEGQPTTSGKTITLNVTGRDGTATAGQDYSFLPKMFILAPGEGSANIEVDIHGDTTQEADEDYHFDIVAINVRTDSAVSFVIENDDDPPAISIQDSQVAENHLTPSGPEVITSIVLSKPSLFPVRVRVRTADGTAAGASDYVPSDQVIEIPAGQTSAPVSTFVRNDMLDESDERYFIDLSDAVGATIGDGRAVVTILDDDLPPQVRLLNLNAPEGDAGTRRVAVTATLVGPSGAPDAGQPTTSGKDITLTVASEDQTAKSGEHYTLADRSVYFPSGTSQAPIGIDIYGNTADAPDRTFKLLVAGTNTSPDAPNAPPNIFTIIDDDDAAEDTTPPTIDINPNIRIAADSIVGTVVNFAFPSAADDQPGVTVACVPASGSLFPIGTTTVTCTATDLARNTAQSEFTTTVVVGQPRITARIVGQGIIAPGERYFDLAVSNEGTGHARELRIFGVRVRVLGGGGAASVNNVGPIDVGGLDVGSVRIIRVPVSVTGNVRRLAFTVDGALTTVRLRPQLRFATGSSVILTNP